MASFPQQDWYAFQEQVGGTVQVDPDDPLDVVECYPREDGHGIRRSLQSDLLRAAIVLS